MNAMGLSGAVRGRRKITTISDKTHPRPPDLVNRQFIATRPNQLWISDFTYVPTWRGFAYTAFVIDVFARKIVEWRVASAMTTDLTLDALEQALHDREVTDEMVHHSDRGPVFVHSLHGSTCGRGNRTVGRKCRRFVRQRYGGINHRTL